MITALLMLFTTKHVAKAAQVHVAAAVQARRKGYRAGEGPFTRLDGDKPVHICQDGGELGGLLFTLSEHLPGLRPWRGKKLAMTISEGEELRALLIPVADLIGLPPSPPRDNTLASCTDALLMFLAHFPQARMR